MEKQREQLTESMRKEQSK